MNIEQEKMIVEALPSLYPLQEFEEKAIHKVIDALPSAEPEKCTETHDVCLDAISRQAAIDALDEQIEQCDKSLSSFDISIKDEFAVKVERASLEAFRETLEYLPTAEPQRIRGKWIYHIDDLFPGESTMECNQCHAEQPLICDDEFCPKCGAKMEGTE